MLDDIIGWFNQWTTDNYIAIGARMIKIILIWVGARVFIWFGNFLIKGFFDNQSHSRLNVNK